MRIPCPYCGERDAREFVSWGDAAVARPDAQADARAFHDYVFLRQNPAGPIREYWFHASGCHCWLVVHRDTRTHEIDRVRFAGEMDG